MARTLTPSERDWLSVRSYLAEHRHELAVQAAGDFPEDSRIDGTPLLAAPAWLLPAPVPLQDISLELRPGAAAADGSDSPHDAAEAAARLLPRRADGARYRRYSEVMAELAAPAVFENRPTYRLTAADLSARPRLVFTVGRYFDGVDVGEAAAHEYAAARLGRAGHPAPRRPAAGAPAPGQPATGAPAPGLRGLLADPFDLRRRPANLAISTLTLRLDRKAGQASFLMHWRDPTAVGHAGGLHQVVPVGVFQPSGEAARSQQHDFSLWRCMIREFAEELCGHAEHYGAGPVAYDSWPFAREMTAALSCGQVRVWCLGLGTDPLTYATDLLTVAVIDSDVFDAWFGQGQQPNEEGTVLAAREFAAHVIDRTLTREPVQAAGAALLRLAWEHRETVGG